ncbi:GntR family transcriptional regulator / MocR family aminotransferase [Bradyrhizobium sp. Gha]|nr:GntR family transcriptional regulator / MocR family aminotransferase [Bradyrhizobium sp. Gha]
MDRRMPEPKLVSLRVDPQKNMPLHKQLCVRIKRAIATGSLPPGTQLPSSRSLASQLSVSRTTVELAYSILASEGFVIRRGAAGTRIGSCPVGETPRRPARSPRPLLPGLASEAARAPRLFQMGLPALDAFPRKLWSRLAASHARSLSFSKMVYQGASGYAPLRQAIANRLTISRGISSSETQVFITAGFLGALTLIARTLLAPGDKMWVEDPGFPPARHALELAGVDLIPVPVDRDGIHVSAGIALAPAARLALVTPAAQFPLGIALSADRWSQLVSWATAAKAWIVNDDYDGDFNHSDRSLSVLKPHDRADRVLHVGSFSNLLFPGLRLGYLVAPISLTDEFERASALLPTQQSLLDQMVVSDFITQGHLGRHLARMRRLYSERKLALVEALKDVLGDSIHVAETGGTHLVLHLPADTDDVALANRARALGLAINALSPMGIRIRTGPGLLLGFTNVPADTAQEATQRLKRALFTSGVRRPPQAHATVSNRIAAPISSPYPA